MEFNELKNELRKCTFSQTRADEESFFEAVISKAELAKLTPVLEGLLGPPVDPESGNLSEKLKAQIKELGGVMGGQSLYVLSQQDACLFLMLWPWSNGSLITLKACKK